MHHKCPIKSLWSRGIINYKQHAKSVAYLQLFIKVKEGTTIPLRTVESKKVLHVLKRSIIFFQKSLT